MRCFAKIVIGCNYFHGINLQLSLLHEINMIFLNTGLIFTLEVLVKNYGAGRGQGPRIFDIPIDIFQ